MEIRVAIVEDQDEVRKGLAYLVDSADGFRCAGAFPDAETAVAELDRCAPDVVLMDVGLPGMSGTEATRHIRERRPATQVMMLTVYEDEARIFESLRAGATGYVLKKTPPAQLLESIGALHRGGSPISSQIARRVIEVFHGVVLGIVAVLKAPPRRQWTLAAVALGLAPLSLAALLLTPVRTLPVTSYEPPPTFEPWFVFSLMDDVDSARSMADPITLPFRRIDIATQTHQVRALPVDSTMMCAANLPEFALLEQLRVGARIVAQQCRAGDDCSRTRCSDCAPYRLMFVQAGDTAFWHDVSAAYLVSTANGQHLIELLERTFREIQPWAFCESAATIR